ncbi:hypothetical protein TraAM80_08003, partial [Trypanosoma rangeli]
MSLANSTASVCVWWMPRGRPLWGASSGWTQAGTSTGFCFTTTALYRWRGDRASRTWWSAVTGDWWRDAAWRQCGYWSRCRDNNTHFHMELEYGVSTCGKWTVGHDLCFGSVEKAMPSPTQRQTPSAGRSGGIGSTPFYDHANLFSYHACLCVC